MKGFVITCIKLYFALLVLILVSMMLLNCGGLNLSLKEFDLQTETEQVQNPNQPVSMKVDEFRR